MAATESLSELRWLAVADVVGNFTHRQIAASEHLGRTVHPHGRQVLAERRVANFGESAL